MNQRESAIFLAFCFFLLNVSLANDAQRVIILSSIVEIRALQAQVLMLNQRRRRRRGRRFPRFCTLPRPDQSWFEIHYFDASIPGNYFRKHTVLAYTHCADRSYLCRSPKEREHLIGNLDSFLSTRDR